MDSVNLVTALLPIVGTVCGVLIGVWASGKRSDVEQSRRAADQAIALIDEWWLPLRDAAVDETEPMIIEFDPAQLTAAGRAVARVHDRRVRFLASRALYAARDMRFAFQQGTVTGNPIAAQRLLMNRALGALQAHAHAQPPNRRHAAEVRDYFERTRRDPMQ